MSCQAGMWNFDGKPIDREFLGKLGASIVQYGPDQADEWGRGGPGEYVHENVAMIYRPFHTNKESRLERQPYVTRCKDTGAVRNVMTWDGRLDNREELIRALSASATVATADDAYTDAAIVMAAWERWGTDCFKKLIGDFSLAVWDAKERTLTLAKDFIGVRYLYYEILPEGMRGGARTDPELGNAEPPSGPCAWWCSRLEPLILLSGRQYEINEEYIAGYFAFHPANHITPYVGVHALPAGHYVQIRAPFGATELSVSSQTKQGLRSWLASAVSEGSRGDSRPFGSAQGGQNDNVGYGTGSRGTGHGPLVTKVQYWHFDPDKRITYKTDAEYEEHFRQVFFQSVKRRLRADAPVVAGLSGGRDSSAIVCVADELIAHGEAETPRLDTYSRYAEDEPFQNDKSYLTIIEQKRGRIGHHFAHDKIDSSTLSNRHSTLAPRRLRPLEFNYFSAHPGIDQSSAEGFQNRMEFMKANGYRIILSGIGGDEVTGGVPYCIAELANLLVQRRLIRLVKQLNAWSLAKKLPWTRLLKQTLQAFRPDFIRRTFWNRKSVWDWIDLDFIERHLNVFMQGERVCIPEKGLPSFRTNVSVATGVSRQLGHIAKLHRLTTKENCYDRCLPFLDRDFLEFMFTIPREQVIRPGQHRSLMRRALTGVIPIEILNRTRKAFAVRRPALGIQSSFPEIQKLFTNSLGSGFGYVNREIYLETVDNLVNGKNNLMIPVQRTIILEMWLLSLVQRRIVKGSISAFQSSETVLEGVA